MIILHAGRVGKQSFFWGESPAEKKISVVRRGRKPKNPVVKPYPYDSGLDNLSSALELFPVVTGRRAFAAHGAMHWRVRHRAGGGL